MERAVKKDPSDELTQLRVENEKLHEMVARLEGLVYRDALTGLRNRRYLDERLAEEVARTQRWLHSVSVLVVDVDGLKEVNDSRGHLAGDEVLCWVGRFLCDEVRFTDVVCRTGGDEFVLLLPDTDEEGVAIVASYLRKRIQVLFERGIAPVTFSVGTSTTRSGQTQSPHELLARADQTMYGDKRRPRAVGAPGELLLKVV